MGDFWVRLYGETGIEASAETLVEADSPDGAERIAREAYVDGNYSGLHWGVAGGSVEAPDAVARVEVRRRGVANEMLPVDGTPERNARDHMAGIAEWYKAEVWLDDDEMRAVRRDGDGDEIFLPEVLDVTRHFSFQLSTSPLVLVMATWRHGRIDDARMEALTSTGWEPVGGSQDEEDALIAFASEMHASLVPDGHSGVG